MKYYQKAGCVGCIMENRLEEILNTPPQDWQDYMSDEGIDDWGDLQDQIDAVRKQMNRIWQVVCPEHYPKN